MHKLHRKTGIEEAKHPKTRGSVYSESLLIQAFFTEEAGSAKTLLCSWKKEHNTMQDFVSAISETMSADRQSGRKFANSGTTGNLVSTIVPLMGEARTIEIPD